MRSEDLKIGAIFDFHGVKYRVIDFNATGHQYVRAVKLSESNSRQRYFFFPSELPQMVQTFECIIEETLNEV